MRTKLIALIAALSTLALASATQAAGRTTADAFSAAFTLASTKMPGQSNGSLKGRGGPVKDTFPSGCTHGNDHVDRCSQFCIESASGNICVPESSCYYKGEQVPC